MTATVLAHLAPAGGSPITEVLAAGGVSLIAVVVAAVIGFAHRRRDVLGGLVRFAEDRTGLPAWSVVPLVIVTVSLVTAVWGYYWDVSWHIDRGRDPGAFANPAHWFIIAGLAGISLAALAAVFFGDDRSPSALRLSDRWSVPAGAVLLSACGLIALAGFPLDDVWHRLFGQDVTAWGPTHIQMIGGASLSTLACWVLIVEGRRTVDGPLPRLGALLCRVSDAGLAGGFLIGLSTLQVEYDFGVPQFRQLEQPILLALAAGIGLVAARIRVGRGGALRAAAVFVVVRGLLAVGVGLAGRTVLHFPLYVVEALIVEVVAMVVTTDRPLRFGAVSGVLIGTVGFGAEWVWSRMWMPLGWSGTLLPGVLVMTTVAGTAAGVIGGLTGRALTARQALRPAPKPVVVASWVALLACVLIALPLHAHRDWTADLNVQPAPRRGALPTAFVTVRLHPAGIERHAVWFNMLSWQFSHNGGPGGEQITRLVAQPDGTYRTAKPVPVGGTAKTLLRLHTGGSMQSLAVFLPDDPAIPARAVPAVNGTRPFEPDKHILQREAHRGRVNLQRAAYAALGLLGAVWIAVLAWGLVRLERHPVAAPGVADTHDARRRTRPRFAPTGA